MLYRSEQTKYYKIFLLELISKGYSFKVLDEEGTLVSGHHKPYTNNSQLELWDSIESLDSFCQIHAHKDDGLELWVTIVDYEINDYSLHPDFEEVWKYYSMHYDLISSNQAKGLKTEYNDRVYLGGL